MDVIVVVVIPTKMGVVEFVVVVVCVLLWKTQIELENGCCEKCT